MLRSLVQLQERRRFSLEYSAIDRASDSGSEGSRFEPWYSNNLVNHDVKGGTGFVERRPLFWEVSSVGLEHLPSTELPTVTGLLVEWEKTDLIICM